MGKIKRALPLIIASLLCICLCLTPVQFTHAANTFNSITLAQAAPQSAFDDQVIKPVPDTALNAPAPPAVLPGFKPLQAPLVLKRHFSSNYSNDTADDEQANDVAASKRGRSVVKTKTTTITTEQYCRKCKHRHSKTKTVTHSRCFGGACRR